MNIKALFADDDAVSPVIGVILMVAITVILAAVIGAFVLGFGGGGPAAPSVQWDVSEGENASGASTTEVANFTHNGGDAIQEPSQLEAGGAADTLIAHDSAPLQAGSMVELQAAGGSYDPGDEIDIVWSPSGSSDTSIIGEHTWSGT